MMGDAKPWGSRVSGEICREKKPGSNEQGFQGKNKTHAAKTRQGEGKKGVIKTLVVGTNIFRYPLCIGGPRKKEGKKITGDLPRQLWGDLAEPLSNVAGKITQQNM